jgi:hypothetical protein
MSHNKCKLCGKRRRLVRSHLMPAALYAMSREVGARVPNPIMVTRLTSVSTSRQIWARLLCTECEHRFNVGGEHYVLTLVHEGTHFPLLERLNVAVPLEETNTLAVYSGPAVGIDVEKVAYFALSVFWRASVHRWRTPHGGAVWNNLGQYEEPIRQYLHGEAGFPADVVVAVVPCTDNGSQGSFYTPYMIRGHEVPEFGMLVRGVHFRLFVGADLPHSIRNACCFSSPRQVILKGSCRSISTHAFAFLHETSRPSRALRSP